ncbi:uncharacterized protein CBL_13146 [Carabus blaptoides fortunei]
MELSKQIRESLNLINNPNNITDDGFRKLLDNCFGALLNKPDIYNITTINSSKADVIKEIYASLLTFVAELARHDCSVGTVTAILNDDLHFSQNRNELFCKMYEKQKERLQIALSSFGSHPPHIVDANWKMNYIIKTCNSNQSEGPIYRIRLSTEVYDETTEKKRCEYVHFNCNVQQLQDLVYKLKDAVRHCEKLSLDN